MTGSVRRYFGAITLLALTACREDTATRYVGTAMYDATTRGYAYAWHDDGELQIYSVCAQIGDSADFVSVYDISLVTRSTIRARSGASSSARTRVC